jgi:threonine dehydrogenase-like Zn-dependent dehydrogenase
MRAAWLAAQQVSVRDVPVPAPGPGEALVRVSLAGVCATDLELLRGYYPYDGVPGHEFVGTVAAAPGAPERVGERVVGRINAACGACARCAAGAPEHCAARTVLGIVGRDGAFAEYLALPLPNLLPVPPALPDEVAVFTELLAAALQVTTQVAVRPADRVVLVGAGRLGQLVARVLALTGCDLTVVARHARQVELLAAVGVRTAAADDLPTGAADLVVEATGNPGGFAAARRLVRPRGTIVLKSTYRGALTLDASALVVDEVTLVGSRCGPFSAALNLLASGRIDPRPLVEARYPLAGAPAALAHAARPGALAVLLEPPAARPDADDDHPDHPGG